MTTATFGIPDRDYLGNAGSISTFALNNTTFVALAAFLTFPKAGTIDRIGYVIPSGSGSPTGTLRFGLETAGTGKAPSGTYLASNAAFVDVINPLTGSGRAVQTLGSSFTVTQGQVGVATVRIQTAVLINGTNFWNFNREMALITTSQRPYYSVFNGSTWAASSSHPLLFALYSDNTVVGLDMLIGGSAWNSGTANPYRGNYWIPAVDTPIRNLLRCIAVPSNCTYDVLIYKNNITSPVFSQSITPDVDAANTGNGILTSPCEGLVGTAGDTWRFIIHPTTTNTIGTFAKQIYTSAAAFAFIGGGSNFGVSEGSPGSWTDTANAAYPIVPSISAVTYTAGSAGMLVNPGQHGGGG